LFLVQQEAIFLGGDGRYAPWLALSGWDLEFEKIKIKFENDAAFDWALNKPTTSRSI
jgi:hypothetical protein